MKAIIPATVTVKIWDKIIFCDNQYKNTIIIAPNKDKNDILLLKASHITQSVKITLLTKR